MSVRRDERQALGGALAWLLDGEAMDALSADRRGDVLSNGEISENSVARFDYANRVRTARGGALTRAFDRLLVPLFALLALAGRAVMSGARRRFRLEKKLEPPCRLPMIC